MTGLLSQALANLETSAAQVKGLTGLPADAKAIQSQFDTLVSQTVTLVQGLQTSTSSFVTTTTPQLEAVLAGLKGSTDLDEIAAQLKDIEQAADALKTTATSVADQVSAQEATISGFATPLAKVTSDLNTQKATLQGKLSTAQDKEKAAHKKYLYLLALGPLGLIGLAAALGLYESWQKEANDDAKNVSAIKSQISQLDSMVNATNQMATDFEDVNGKTQDVVNAVGFLSQDVSSLITDTASGTSRVQLEIYVTAAKQELITVTTDAA